MTIEAWKILNSSVVFDNPWCRVRQDAVQLANGAIVPDYFVNVRPDIALVLPITVEGEVIFVRQYRHGVQQVLLELPAGTFDRAQEDSYQAAARELEEETGYVASHWRKLATLYDNPVKDTNQIHLFLAQNAVPQGQQALDPTENLEIVLIPSPEIARNIATGEICVAGSLAALYLAQSHLPFSRL
ncbi:MAG: NUDIX hydrolase [Chloroflexaceae bacterium]|nr:NUDIX hydrolase [Chloroflexaceae bacterium]